MTANIGDGICAYLTGGVGNQLFVLAAGIEQARRLDCPLYVDASGYLKPNEPRTFDLGGLDLPGVVLGADSPWASTHPKTAGTVRGKIKGRGRTIGRTVFHEAGFAYDPAIETIEPGTTLVGYYQSHKYFSRTAEIVISMLQNSRLSSVEKELLRATGEDSVTVHARRGDYLNAGTADHHGVTSSDYFERSLGLVRRLTSVGDIRVFSDSPSVVANEFSFWTDSPLQVMDDDPRISTVATIRLMSSGAAFVMSNSSFSWWAARLMTHRDPSAPVVAPRPWLASGESASDLLLPGWMTLDAR